MKTALNVVRPTATVEIRSSPLGGGREVVQEEPEHREVARLGNPFRQQDHDLALRQCDFLRESDPVGDVDAEEVGGDGERPLREHRPHAVVARLLWLELTAAPRHRDLGRGRDDALVGQLSADERGRDVEGVLLPRGRRPEPGADCGAQRDRVVQRDAGGDLAVGRRAGSRRSPRSGPVNAFGSRTVGNQYGQFSPFGFNGAYYYTRISYGWGG